MKIIKVPYNKNVQSIIDSGIAFLAVCGILLMILAISQLNGVIFLIGALIAIPACFYLWKTLTLQILIWPKDFINIQIISTINDAGFTINNNQKIRRITWQQVKSAELVDEKTLILTLKNGEQLEIEEIYARWYALLQKIPISKRSSSIISKFLKKTFADLKTCQICGSIALTQQKCLSCKSLVYNAELAKEFSDEKAYFKAEQLELFCTDGPHEKVDFFPEENDGFERDKNWQPMVSKKEVIAFSKINYWD